MPLNTIQLGVDSIKESPIGNGETIGVIDAIQEMASIKLNIIVGF